MRPVPWVGGFGAGSVRRCGVTKAAVELQAGEARRQERSGLRACSHSVRFSAPVAAGQMGLLRWGLTMSSLIWIIAIVGIWIAIGVPSWVIIQIAEKLAERSLDHDSLYGWATLAAFAAMFMLPSREHTTHLQNFVALAEAFSGGAIIGALLNVVYQWTFMGTKSEKTARAWGLRLLDKVPENKIVSVILGGILLIVLTVAGVIVIGMRMEGVPLLSPLASWLWDTIRPLI